MSKPSADRVSFLIPCRQLTSGSMRSKSSAPDKTYGGSSNRVQRADKQALELALGMNESEVEQAAAMQRRVVCRPSQFARYIVIRCRLGGSNQVRLMDPVLVPEQRVNPLDVANRSNQVYEMMHGPELRLMTGEAPMLARNADISELDGDE